MFQVDATVSSERKTTRSQGKAGRRLAIDTDRATNLERKRRRDHAHAVEGRDVVLSTDRAANLEHKRRRDQSDSGEEKRRDGGGGCRARHGGSRIEGNTFTSEGHCVAQVLTVVLKSGDELNWSIVHLNGKVGVVLAEQVQLVGRLAVLVDVVVELRVDGHASSGRKVLIKI